MSKEMAPRQVPDQITWVAGLSAILPRINAASRSFPAGLLLLVIILTITSHTKALAPEEEAWTLLAQGKSQEAASAAQRILAGEPTNARAVACWAEAMQKLGQEPEVRNHLLNLEQPGAESAARLLGLGTIELVQLNRAKAESLFSQALLEISASADPRAEMVVREQSGLALVSLGQPEKAIASLERALELADSLAERLAVIYADYLLGYSWMAGGDNQKAEEHLLRALHDARSRELHEWVGDIEICLSLLPRWEMDLEETQRHLAAALEAYEQAGNLSRQASCLRHMASISFHRRELADAIRKFHRAQGLAQEAGHTSEAARCLGDLGNVSLALGDCDRAVRQWQEALRLAGDIWPKEWSGIYLSNIGSALVELERYEEAFAYFDRALRTLSEGHSRRGQNWGATASGPLPAPGRERYRSG